MGTSYCKLCDRQVRPYSNHLKTHGITRDEYLQQYEPETYKNKRTAEILWDLYVTVYRKFGLMTDSSRKWVQVETGTGHTRPHGLQIKDLINHLEGKSTIGVYAPTRQSQFITFDIDTTDLNVLELVYNAVNQYIPHEYINITWSGNKGYHIDIFFTSMINKRTLEQFYEIILRDTELPKHIVECYGITEKCIKLPLGVHFAADDPSNNWCYFVNQYGIKEGDGMSRIFNIRKFEASKLFEIIEINYNRDYFTEQEVKEIEDLKKAVQSSPAYNHSIKSKTESVEELIKNGIQYKGTRHNSTLAIAIYLKDRSYSAKAAEQYLINWTFQKCKPNLYKSSQQEIIREIHAMCKTVWKKPYKTNVTKRKVTLNRMELKEILSVPGKPLRKLYFVLFTHCKAYGDDTGAFYMSYKQMNEVTNGNKSNAHLFKQIDRLQALGKIEIVRHNHKEPGSTTHNVNVYRIAALKPEIEMEIGENGKIFNLSDSMSPDEIGAAVRQLLSPKEIKEIFGREALGMIG